MKEERRKECLHSTLLKGKRKRERVRRCDEGLEDDAENVVDLI